METIPSACCTRLLQAAALVSVVLFAGVLDLEDDVVVLDALIEVVFATARRRRALAAVTTVVTVDLPA